MLSQMGFFTISCSISAKNVRMAFLGRNTPTPLLSEFTAQVNDTIVEAVSGMELEVGMWIGLHIFANLLT